MTEFKKGVFDNTGIDTIHINLPDNHSKFVIEQRKKITVYEQLQTLDLNKAKALDSGLIGKTVLPNCEFNYKN